MELDDLIQNIHQFFISQYGNSLDQTQTFLAFEPLGLMVSPDDFMYNGTFNPTLAGQQISMIADVVPVIGDTFQQDAMNKISDQYVALTGNGTNLLGSIMFYDKNIDSDQLDQYLALFGNLKSNAQQRFSQSGEQASVKNPSSQVADCNVNPGTWYDKDSPIWQKKSFQQSQSQPVSPPSPNRPVFMWKLNPNSQVMATNIHIQHVLLNNASLLNVREVRPDTVDNKTYSPPTSTVPATKVLMKTSPQMESESHMMMHSTNAAENTSAPASTNMVRSTTVTSAVTPVRPIMVEPGKPIINKTNYFALRKTLPFTQMVNLNRVIGLNNNVVGQPVNSSQFTIDFSYSLVNIERDWMYQPLLDKAELWYALTMKAGDFSTGENSASNKGLLRCIPKAMIVVKDVTISAAWSDTDKQLATTAYGFGCFNISGSQPISSNTNNQLVAPGVQIIAWICEVLPKLPLNDDPTMETATNGSNPPADNPDNSQPQANQTAPANADSGSTNNSVSNNNSTTGNTTNNNAGTT